jgi:hypothetical protein
LFSFTVVFQLSCCSPDLVSFSSFTVLSFTTVLQL